MQIGGKVKLTSDYMYIIELNSAVILQTSIALSVRFSP